MKKLILISAFVCMLTVGMTSAQIIKLDENGHGTFDGRPLDYGIGAPDIPGVDPFPGLTLFYHLPFNVVEGDLQIVEPDGGISDVLRFVNDPLVNASRVFVYSEKELTSFERDLADTGIPMQPWINPFIVPEIGLEGGRNGVIWYPTPNQPGWGTVTGAAPITYDFISDVPEPATLLLLGLGGVLLRKRSA